MATFLDLSALNFFNPVFAGLFIMLAVFAILNKTEILGKNGAIQWVAAILTGLIFASVRTLTRTFEIAAPWTIMLIILILFINLTSMFMGASGDDLPLNPKNLSIMTLFAITVAIIFFVSLGQAMHEKDVALEAQGVEPVETFGGQLGETIRNPAVLGLILVFLIATFTVLLLAAKPSA